MKTERLVPTNGQKSFGGKAEVIFCDDGWKLLKSYGTIMCGIGPDLKCRRFSSARSATTSRHVTSFLDSYLKLGLKVRDFYSWPLTDNPHAELEEEQ